MLFIFNGYMLKTWNVRSSYNIEKTEMNKEENYKLIAYFCCYNFIFITSLFEILMRWKVLVFARTTSNHNCKHSLLRIRSSKPNFDWKVNRKSVILQIMAKAKTCKKESGWNQISICWGRCNIFWMGKKEK